MNKKYKLPIGMIPVVLNGESVTFSTWIAGLKDVDLNKIKLAGEDIIKDIMFIGIHDLPSWIKEKAKFELDMPKEDLILLKEYFEKLEIK